MVLNMSEVDLAYIAGFLDGEGCFSTQRNSQASIRITVSNTYKPVLDWLQENFGGNVRPHYKNKSKIKKNHRPVYVWDIMGKGAEYLCKIIAPFLKEKTEQALLLIGLAQTKQIAKRKGVPEEVKLQRERLASKLTKLKRVSYGS